MVAVSRGRITALDGLRGIAIALVLLRHGFGLPGGGIVGVQLFFVLSGFLITSLIVEERASTGRVSFRGFYQRRAARLLPALLVFLACYVAFALATFSASHWHEAKVGALTTLFYVNNLSSLTGWANSVELGPMWTLSTEEQFYLLWPLVLLTLIAIRPRISRQTWAAFATLAFAFLVVYRAVAWSRYGVRIYSFPVTWVDGLLGGALLAAPSVYRFFSRVSARRAIPAAIVCLLAAITLVPNLKNDTATYVVGVSAISALGMAMVSLAINSNMKWLCWPPLVWLGRVSYAAYLWNQFMYSVARNVLPAGLGYFRQVVAIVGALVVAELSMRFVERPILRRFGRRDRASGGSILPEQRQSSRAAQV